MRKAGTINEFIFNVGSLTADSDGLFSIYSQTSINGTIHSIGVGSNNHTNTGSLLFFTSGTDNGINNNGLILQLRAGSKMATFYPVRPVHNFDGILPNAGSTTYIQSVSNEPFRVVGSGLGDGTSGLKVVVRYI